jgi:RNA polymerase sigma factor (TIGR02999 family)
MSDVTVLLRRMAEGHPGAIDELFGTLYAELHRLGHGRLSQGGPITLLDTTSLAHEAFLRLKNAGRIDLDSRGQFMAYVSRVLRSVIVDFVRKRSADKRGGHQAHVTLDTEVADEVGAADRQEIERVNDALLELEKSDPRLRQVVEMRFFGGLSEQEIAEILGVSDRTVRSDWVRARLLLSVTLRR